MLDVCAAAANSCQLRATPWGMVIGKISTRPIGAKEQIYHDEKISINHSPIIVVFHIWPGYMCGNAEILCFGERI